MSTITNDKIIKSGILIEGDELTITKIKVDQDGCAVEKRKEDLNL